jgi:hypothetical protein
MVNGTFAPSLSAEMLLTIDETEGEALMERTNRSRIRTWAWSTLAGMSIGLAAVLLQAPLVSLAAEFGISGTVDCGRRSGQSCSFEGSEPMMVIHTKDISGVMERIVVDVSWIMPHLRERSIDQDDTICLDVENKPDGTLRAVAYTNLCDDKGTDNPGLSTEDDDVGEQGDDDDDDDDDDDGVASDEGAV